MKKSKDRQPILSSDLEDFVKVHIVRMQKVKNDLLQKWQDWRQQKSLGYRRHAEYQKAVNYREQFTPKEGINYSWVCQYSRESYEWLHQIFTSLDEKADSVIKHLTGGTGLLALGAIGLISQ